VLTFLGLSNRACKFSLQAGLREDRRFQNGCGRFGVQHAVTGSLRGRSFILQLNEVMPRRY
jgi:hypothetical protein